MAGAIRGFPNCRGIVDGTLFPLEFKPQVYVKNSSTSNGSYVLHSLVFCDHSAEFAILPLTTTELG